MEGQGGGEAQGVADPLKKNTQRLFTQNIIFVLRCVVCITNTLRPKLGSTLTVSHCVIHHGATQKSCFVRVDLNERCI
jgi:hypothetical protein